MSDAPQHHRSFLPHSQRATILGEIHARPFRPVEGSRAFLLYAFEVLAGEAARVDRAALDDLCRARASRGLAKTPAIT